MEARSALGAVMLWCGLESAGIAHHSHFYDECRPVAIEGRVERVEFKNPHNLIVLTADDGTSYTVDFVNVTRLTSAGIIGPARAAVVAGARVAVTGYLIKGPDALRAAAPKFKGAVNPNTVEAHSLRRVDASFNWPPAPPPRTSPPHCAP